MIVNICRYVLHTDAKFTPQNTFTVTYRPISQNKYTTNPAATAATSAAVIAATVLLITMATMTGGLVGWAF